MHKYSINPKINNKLKVIDDYEKITDDELYEGGFCCSNIEGEKEMNFKNTALPTIGGDEEKLNDLSKI